MPAAPWSGYHRFCPLARALDVVGERWTLVIAHELLGGPRRYGELQRRLPGIGSSLLADRLRKLELAGVVERSPGERGAVVLYGLTEAGRDLAPAMEALRSWGVRYLYEPVGGGGSAGGEDAGEECFDVSFVGGWEELPAEDYEWHIDGEPVTLRHRGGELRCRRGVARAPAVVADTTSEFMRRWAAGTTSWDQGRADGDVRVEGDAEAWERMQAATGYRRAYAPRRDER